MHSLIQNAKVDTHKEVCSERIEALIVSGRLPVGKKLPSERKLAKQLGVTRPMIHDALVDLAGKGLVNIVPRVGTIINDYRKEGSIALLKSLIRYQDGALSPKLLNGLLATRELVEVENARLAASLRTVDHIKAMRKVIRAEALTDPDDIPQLTELDFDLHHLVAMASDNQTSPLLLNAFKQVYTNLANLFFSDSQVVPIVLGFHRDLVDAIDGQDDQLAVAVMRCLLSHGEEQLRKMIPQALPL